MRTGIHALDLMFGNGVPLGRIIELFGDESTGKSLLAWEIAKSWQRKGGVVVVFDTEATAPKRFMARIGLNIKDIIYRKPETIEELEQEFFAIHNSLQKNEPGLRVLYIHDSVAATSSKAEWEVDLKTKMLIPKEGGEMAARARAMSRFARRMASYISSSQSVYLAVNQVRDKIGVMYGEKTTTPGGRALKFHSSIRLQLNRGARIDQAGTKPIGVICNAFVKKNKCAEPFRKAPLRILWKEGFDRYGGLVEILEAQERIKRAKAGRFRYNGITFRTKSIEKIVRECPELLKAMY
jgi:recombination protein RecA